MEPPTSTAPKKLKIRAYDCALSTRKTREKLDKLVATAPVFNESWVTGDLFMTARIGGMQQYGDILVQHVSQRPRNELTIQYRAGDEALVEAIAQGLAKDLTPKEPRLVPGKKRPEGLAFFFEMIQASPLRRQVLIADAVIEEAHELGFDDYREIRSKLEFLSMVPRLGVLQRSLDERVQKDYQEATRVHAKPRYCLFQGKKIALRHRVKVISDMRDEHLALHFAKISDNQILVGWVQPLASWDVGWGK